MIGYTQGGGLERVQLFILAEGLKIGIFRYRENSLLQFFMDLVYALTSSIQLTTWLGDL